MWTDCSQIWFCSSLTSKWLVWKWNFNRCSTSSRRMNVVYYKFEKPTLGFFCLYNNLNCEVFRFKSKKKKVCLLIQSVYTKSGCRSPNSIQALNFSSSAISFSGVKYFWSSFACTPGRFLTLFLQDKYAMFIREPTIRMMELHKLV